MNDHFDDDSMDEELPPSRTAQKREAEALQKLGVQLLALTPEQLAKFPLPDNLRDALLAAQSLTRHGALRRQRQYIGKLMRKIDTTDIERQLADLEHGRSTAAHAFHQLERWRDRMIAEGDPALGEFLADYPEADRNRLRNAIRKAQTASDEQKSATARALFRLLREQLEGGLSGAGEEG